MRDRLVTAAGALLVLVLLAALLLGERRSPVARPTLEERGPNGYWALAEWLRGSAVHLGSFRHRFGELAARHDGRGHLLVTTMPHQTRLAPGEANALREWVARGNTLLVLAALDDSPDWAVRAATRQFLLADLEALTGIEFDEPDAEDGRRSAIVTPYGPDRSIELHPVAAHPLAAGVSGLRGHNDLVARRRPAAAAAAPSLRLATLRGRDAAWQVPHGSGDIFLVSLGSLLTNRAVGDAGNATLFANLLRHHLAGSVLFDDMHQGLSALYDPVAFYADSRLHMSILLVLSLWLVYMVGSWNRLAPAREAPAQPGQQDFVAAVGGFLARKLDPVDAGRLLFANWFAQVAGREATFDEPPWRQLEGNPLMNRALLAQLRASHARLAAGHRENLPLLRNRIRRATGQTGKQD